MKRARSSAAASVPEHVVTPRVPEPFHDHRIAALCDAILNLLHAAGSQKFESLDCVYELFSKSFPEAEITNALDVMGKSGHVWFGAMGAKVCVKLPEGRPS